MSWLRIPVSAQAGGSKEARVDVVDRLTRLNAAVLIQFRVGWGAAGAGLPALYAASLPTGAVPKGTSAR